MLAVTSCREVFGRLGGWGLMQFRHRPLWERNRPRSVQQILNPNILPPNASLRLVTFPSAYNPYIQQ